MIVAEKKLNELKLRFEELADLRGLKSEIRKTVDGPVLIIFISFIAERFYSILDKAISDTFGEAGIDGAIAVLKRAPQSNLIDGPEAKLLIKVLSESQNVSRHSFGPDFFERYTKSLTGAEEQIVSKANHILYGRRGAGKSMLLLYSLNKVKNIGYFYAWVDMQLFNSRTDANLYADIILEILRELPFDASNLTEIKNITNNLEQDNIDVAAIRKILPRIKRMISTLSVRYPVFIYLDDFHVIPKAMQPVLLDLIYAISRGNETFMKISAIETMTNPFDSLNKIGLEIAQDTQILRLDNNLTTPDRAAKHLEAVLDAHARYSGLPNIRRLCSSSDVLPRLTWVSAGVPRDAMNLFSQAILKALAEAKRRVTVSSVNMASSETLATKIRDLEMDASGKVVSLKSLLDRIKVFCISEKQKNAFLVEISPSNDVYINVSELIQMRLLHIISEGITPGDAGKKFIALILDYGMYTGIRAAQSVELFNQKTERASYKELRSLPIFRS